MHAVAWLAKDVFLQPDLGVGAQHRMRRQTAPGRQARDKTRLVSGHTLHVVHGCFTCLSFFDDVRGQGLKRDSCLTQKFLAARAGRSEVDHRGRYKNKKTEKKKKVQNTRKDGTRISRDPPPLPALPRKDDK